MNGHYIREMDTAELTRRVAQWISARGIPGADDPRLEQAVAAVRDKVSTLAEVPRLVGFAFGPVETDQKAWDKVVGADAKDLLRARRAALAGVDPFDEAQIEPASRDRGGDRSEAWSRISAPARRHHGHDRVGRDLRESGLPGPRRRIDGSRRAGNA